MPKKIFITSPLHICLTSLTLSLSPASSDLSPLFSLLSLVPTSKLWWAGPSVALPLSSEMFSPGLLKFELSCTLQIQTQTSPVSDCLFQLTSPFDSPPWSLSFLRCVTDFIVLLLPEVFFAFIVIIFNYVWCPLVSWKVLTKTKRIKAIENNYPTFL